MRLINVTTLQLSEFWGDAIPPYAILSHRWGEEEVSFEQVSFSPATAKQMKGFRKIKCCAAQAKTEGLDWCWVDTCCIDKRSSSELSEAINSMYQWYHNAKCCYAYLDDITYNRAQPSTLFLELVVDSKWFSRGWTLQELIAPKNLTFYSSSWANMGQRSLLSEQISRLCGIEKDILDGKVSVDSASIAQRMQWASNRRTTRLEDVAYSLMGIFDVNMPLLYGEGHKSFIRLQEEIIKRSGDQSIFSWVDETATRTTFRGLLARSPSEFRHCGNIYRAEIGFTLPFATTNMGLHISLPITAIAFRKLEYTATLGCTTGAHGKYRVIRLRRTHKNSSQFMRVDSHVRFQGVPQRAPGPTALYVLEKAPDLFSVDTRIAALRLDIETVGLEQCGIWAPYGLQNESNEIRFDFERQEKSLRIRLLFQPLSHNAGTRVLVVLECDLQACSKTDEIDAAIPKAAVGTISASYDINKEPHENTNWLNSGRRLIRLRTRQGVIGDEIMVIAKFHISSIMIWTMAEMITADMSMRVR